LEISLGKHIYASLFKKKHAHFEKFLHLKIEWPINRFVLHY
jgi:hypothetical protein